MKRFLRVTFWLCLTLLVLLGMQQLVVCADEASAEEVSLPSAMPIHAVVALPAQQSFPQEADAQQSVANQPIDLPAQTALTVPEIADGCGWFITGRSYVRTVYIAFHLADAAG